MSCATRILGVSAGSPSLLGGRQDALGNEDLAIRLVQQERIIEVAIQRWTDGAVARLADVCRQAAHAFYNWYRVGCWGPLKGGFLAPVLDAFITAVESVFPEDTPAFDLVLPALLDARLDLLQVHRVSCWRRDPIGRCVDRVLSSIRVALFGFGTDLRRLDEPAWNVIGVCLVSEPDQLAFARRVLRERCGLPDPTTEHVHRIWHAMAEAYCEWEVGRWLDDIRRT